MGGLRLEFTDILEIDENRLAADSHTRLDITRPISNHKASLEIYLAITGGIEQHTWFWLSA